MAVLVLLLIGATVRLTRLLTTDYVFEVPRQWIEQRVPPSAAYLIRCDWCMSMYVGAGVFTAGWHAPSTPTLIVAGALSASLVAGWSATGELAMDQ